MSRFVYHTKDHLAWFSEKKNGWTVPLQFIWSICPGN